MNPEDLDMLSLSADDKRRHSVSLKNPSGRRIH